MGCVWKRGKIYWVKYRRNGRSYYESAHTRNEQEAKDLLVTREADIVRGKPVTSKIGQLRYEEAMIDLVNHHKLNRRNTTKLEQRIALHLTPVFRKRRLSEITTSDLTAYAVDRQADGAANGTINRELALLRRAYHLAKDGDKLLHIPKFRMLRESNPRSGWFERDQIDAMIRHLPDRLGPVVRFGFITGWRVSEVLHLEWRQVDMLDGEIRLDPGTTKNRKEGGRIFPFTQELRILFDTLYAERKCLEGTGHIVRWVFHWPNAPSRRTKGLRKPWATACKRVGLPGRLFHDMRRSAVRNLIRAGVPERVAMAMIGHKTRSIFNRYNIVSPGDLLDAARKLDAARSR